MATRPKPTKRGTRTPPTQFVVDEKGRRTAVLLSMRAYKRLLQAAEDLEDIRAADEARAEGGEPIPWEEVKAELGATPVQTERPQELPIRYVVDEKGRRTAVIVPIGAFEELVELAEQLEDIRHLEANEAVPGEPMPWEQFVAELRAEGKLAREPSP